MTDTPRFNPFPNMPNVTDLGDGRRMVETHDKGHCIEMIEPNGTVSMVISINPPSPPKRVVEDSFQVRPVWSGQEVIDSDGNVVATTTDPNEAALICKLRNLYEKAQRRKGGQQCH